MPHAEPESAIERDQRIGLQRIREFLKVRTSYDVLPLSFRLIIFDTALLVKKSLTILINNGIISAPLWDSKTSSFAGLLTTSDYLNLIQFYWQNPEAVSRIDQFKLSSLREIEKAIGVQPLETVSINPQRPLYEACRKMLESRARRMPLVDIDDETKRAMVVSVVTQYRILKFVAVNVSETQLLRKPLKHLKLGTYKNLETAKMESPVFDVITQLVSNSISSVPILNTDDVITLIKGGVYDDLALTVGEALQKRSEKKPMKARSELVMPSPPRYGNQGYLQIPPQQPHNTVTEAADIDLNQVISPDYPSTQERLGLEFYDGPNDVVNSDHAASRCNAPGLFRISGQASIINALYDFYDCQFSDAGSPSKVEATVGSGLLPTHIEHTLPDVASLFKKILISLPGGLLGSLELFECFEDILLKLQRDSEQVEVDFAALKAKLVALAISSITSTYRVYLIEAVLGLCAYFAFETEKVHAEQAATAIENNERPGSSKSELMSHQSLGVVLGPLLVGDLIDKVEIAPIETLDGTARTSSESTNKSKNKKRTSIPSKLEKDATLTAHVDRANLTANVMQQLLLAWRGVVKQLRNGNGTCASSVYQSRSSSQIKEDPSRTKNRLTLIGLEEETQFMNMLRGGPLPEESRGPSRTKRRVRISSKSPTSMEAVKSSEDEHTCNSEADQPQGNEISDGENGNEPVRHYLRPSTNLETSTPTRRGKTDSGDAAIKRTCSDFAMDRMAMGTILPRQQDSSNPPGSKGHVRLIPSNELSEGEHQEEDSYSSGEAPQTVVRIARTPLYSDDPKPTRQRSSIDIGKPLPAIGSAQRAKKVSPSTSDELARSGTRGGSSSRGSSRRSMSALSSRHVSPRTLFPARHGRHGSREVHFQHRHSRGFGSRELYFPDSYPPRQDSLPVEGHAQINPDEAYESLGEYQARSHAFTSTTKLGSRRGGQAHASPMKNFSRKLSDTRALAPRNASHQESIAQVDGEQLFGNPGRNSVKLIAQQFGEKAEMQKQTEAVKKSDLPIVYAHIRSLPTAQGQALEDPFVHAVSNTDDVTYEDSIVPSLEPFTSMEPEAERMTGPEKESMIPKPRFEIGRGRKVEGRAPSPNKSFNRDTTPPGTHTDRALSRSNSFLQASAELKKLERHCSINNTELFTEICRLRGQLEIKGEEVLAAKRGMAVQKVVEGRKSSEKERANGEAEKARKEMEAWRLRAETAEKILAERAARHDSTQSKDQGTSPGLINTAIHSKDQGPFTAADTLGDSPAHRKNIPGMVSPFPNAIPLSDQRFDVSSRPQTPRKLSRAVLNEQDISARSPQMRHPNLSRSPLGNGAIYTGPEWTPRRNSFQSVAVKKHDTKADFKLAEGSGESVEAEHRCGSECDH
ncbi:5'-AMP-activated protein kinase, regulatory gamma subunit, partial [Lecanoromycetidae sp. Uapishka_2]